MENNDLTLLDCKQELKECKEQLRVLTQRIDVLSIHIDAACQTLDQTECESNDVSIKTNTESSLIQPTLVDCTDMKHIDSKKELNKTDGRASGVKLKPISDDLENKVGKNIFAILASLLILIGVGVFVSTIYEHIPDGLKIGIIYLFGFCLLGIGLKMYANGQNKFWLGVASCGMAELLVSIVTSHTYFKFISLPFAYGLIIAWVVGSFYLTNKHSIVFKLIGYMGFVASNILGVSMLGAGDMGMYISLMVSFVAISFFFLLSNKEYHKLNTFIAFVSTIGMSLFFDLDNYASGAIFQMIAVFIVASICAFNVIYLTKSNLSRPTYAFYSAISALYVTPFIYEFGESIAFPLSMFVLMAVWYLNTKVVMNRNCRLHYSAFAIIYMIIAAMDASIDICLWLFIFTAVAYLLYFVTKKRDIAWIGLVEFYVLQTLIDNDKISICLLLLAASVIFVSIMHSRSVRKDLVLRLAWYITGIFMLLQVKNAIDYMFSDYDNYYWEYATITDSIYYAILAIVNTVYLYCVNERKFNSIKIDMSGIILLLIQGGILTSCFEMIDSEMTLPIILGIASSLLIISYSLVYSIKTNWANRRMVVWQFVKFTLYFQGVLSMLNSPSILIHITLLVIAIIAVMFGFKCEFKSARIYGLVLSIITVASLVLFNVEYESTLQFAGGIILCGMLCFVISFIYSKISKSVIAASNDHIAEELHPELK